MRERYGFLLVGYVVMPDHVHLLISEPPDATPSQVLKALKQRVSRDLRERRRRRAHGQLALPFRQADDGPPRLWQPRFYDFNVWSAKKVREKLEYMHRNPVTRKLVAHPKDWPWSSWSFYAQGKAGLLPVDPVPL
jgi:putative transposase